MHSPDRDTVMDSGIGTAVGNAAFVWLDVDEFTYCLLTDEGKGSNDLI